MLPDKVGVSVYNGSPHPSRGVVRYWGICEPTGSSRSLHLLMLGTALPAPLPNPGRGWRRQKAVEGISAEVAGLDQTRP